MRTAVDVEEISVDMSPAENDEEIGRLAVVVVPIVRIRHEVSTIEDRPPPRIISTRIDMTNNPGTVHVNAVLVCTKSNVLPMTTVTRKGASSTDGG